MYRTLDTRRFILALLLIALGFATLFQRQLPAQTMTPTHSGMDSGFMERSVSLN